MTEDQVIHFCLIGKEPTLAEAIVKAMGPGFEGRYCEELGLSRWGDWGDWCDVILLDLAMPRRTGLEALPELRQVAPAARIIVFSGCSAASVADEVIELGAVRYLSKGADPEEINDAIEEVAALTTLAAL